nr:MAG TPA: YvrJ protein family protein [Caudoviricetes sp.]
MDVNTITQLIGSLGFPIVCCGALFWRMIKSDEKHQQEMDKMSDALNNNTLALTRLTEKLSKEGNT